MRDEREHWAKVVDEQITLLEESLTRQTLEEFKASRDFSVNVKRLLSDKIPNCMMIY